MSMLEGSKDTNPKDALGAKKLPFNLVPRVTMAHLALGHGNGFLKYGGWNWRVAGVRASIYVAAALRHIEAWNDGEECDPDDGVPHLAAALTCLSIIVDARARGKLTDDRPPRVEATALLASLTETFNKLQERAAAKPTAPRNYMIEDDLS